MRFWDSATLENVDLLMRADLLPLRSSTLLQLKEAKMCELAA
jgi:hypothetical protein